MLSRNFGKKCVDVKTKDSVEIMNHLNEKKNFTFDRIFDSESTQKDVFETVTKPLIDDVLKGYNATIFTYGQSGSGKTYTMYGEDILDDSSQGIIPRTINQIFDFINDEKNQDIKFELKFSMLEIYMENLYDLLNPGMKSSDLKIKEHSKKGIYVENLSEIYITSQEEFLLYITEAEKCRSVSETGLNKNSSRSHLLFQLQITQKLQDDTERRGALNLIDLAGSEKVSKTHAIGITLEEAKKINLSLSNLGNVIYALANNNDYIPYRDSKLTRILQDSLGGNSKTLLIINCSVHSYNAEETLSTLQFAKRAKKIKNKAKINIKRSPEQLEAIIEYLTAKLKKANDEIEKLKGNSISLIQTELNNYNNEDTKNKNIGDKENEQNFTNNLFNYMEFSKNNKNNFEILSDMKKNSTLSNNNCFNTDFFTKLMEVNYTQEKDRVNESNNKISIFNEKNNFNSELECESIFDKEKVEFENTLKSKNKEIEDLKNNIENLNNQNNILKERIEQILKENSIEKFINQTKDSMQVFINQIANSYDNDKDNELKQVKENLFELKNYQMEMENRYLDLFKDITDFKEVDFNEKQNLVEV